MFRFFIASRLASGCDLFFEIACNKSKELRKLDGWDQYHEA